VSDATWLPNLVGGTSIWKLAVDLNEPKFFDGRLLVPETEGSESLPVTVRWDLTGLVPLREAHAKYPAEAAAAVKDFQACLERVAKVFATPNSGFDKYKAAFTVPSLDADDGAHYFYSPAKKKLFAINWGASPRSMGGKAEYVFGYEDWAKSWGTLGTATAGAAVGAAAAGVASAAAAAAAPAGKSAPKEEKKDEQKRDPKARPWWLWPLFGLLAIALILVALFLLKACEEKTTTPLADAAADAKALTDTGVDGASLEDGSATQSEAGALDGSADAASADAAATDGGADAAIADGGKDAGKDAGKDGGLAMDNDDDDDDTGGGGGGSLSSGGSSGGGKVIVTIGPAGGTKTSVHRKHYSDDAVAWRVSQGMGKVSRTEQAGKRFDVWLAPGQTFEGVRVEWQDKAGKWHVH
jgi:hypothetical protein